MDKRIFQFVATGLVMMLFGITMVVVGTINNYLTVTFNVDKLFIGLCASVLAAGILTGSFLFGPITDRFGYKPIMLLGVIIVILGIAGIIVVKRVDVIPYIIFVIGLGGGIINGVTNVIVADLYPNDSSAWLSLLGVFYGVGALGLPLITSLMLDWGFDYQRILTVVVLFLLIPLIIVASLKFPHVENKQATPMRQYFKLFGQPAILLIGLFLFFQSAIEAVIPVWTPTYLSEIFMVDYDKGLFAITISALGITFTRLLLSQLLKKIKPYRVVLVSMMVIILGALVLHNSSSFYIGLAGVGIMGFGVAASFPVMLSYIADFFPQNSGSAFSIVIGIALLGNMLLNALMGYLLDSFGIEKLNIFIIIFILIMIVILLIINSKLLKNKNYVSKTMVE